MTLRRGGVRLGPALRRGDLRLEPLGVRRRQRQPPVLRAADQAPRRVGLAPLGALPSYTEPFEAFLMAPRVARAERGRGTTGATKADAAPARSVQRSMVLSYVYLGVRLSNSLSVVD